MKKRTKVYLGNEELWLHDLPMLSWTRNTNADMSINKLKKGGENDGTKGLY